MATGVPGEEVEFGQVEFVHQAGDTPGVLMAAMEQHNRLARRKARRCGGGPVTVEKRHPVMGAEGVLLLFAHRKILMQKGRFVLL